MSQYPFSSQPDFLICSFYPYSGAFQRDHSRIRLQLCQVSVPAPASRFSLPETLGYASHRFGGWWPLEILQLHEGNVRQLQTGYGLWSSLTNCYAPKKVGNLCFLKFLLGDWGKLMMWKSKHLLVGGFRYLVFAFKRIWEIPNDMTHIFGIGWGHKWDLFGGFQAMGVPLYRWMVYF